MTLTLLSESQARFLTDRIRTGAEQVWGLLQQAHQGKAWKALGYDSWRTYATTEFGMSQSRAYQLLDQAKVIGQLAEAVSTDVENLGITEAQARDIASEVDVVAETVRQATDGMVEPDEVKAKVREIVEGYRAKQAARRHKHPHHEPLKDLRRACETIASLGDPDDYGDASLDWGLVARAQEWLSSLLAAREHALTGVS